MSVPFSNTNLRIPRGFGNLLEGLAREVLREQPNDIPSFAAKYFVWLLQQREESGLDPAEWGAKLEDRFYNNHIFKKLPDFEGLNNQEKAAIKIQATYRGYLARQGAKQLKVNKGTVPTSPAEHLTSIEQPAITDIKDVHLKADETLGVKGENIDIWMRPPSSGLSEQAGQEHFEGSDTENIDHLGLELDFNINEDSKVDSVIADTDINVKDTFETAFTGTANVDICATEITQKSILEPTHSGTANVDICATEITLETTTETTHSGTANVDICTTEVTRETTTETTHSGTANVDICATEVTLETTTETTLSGTANVDICSTEITQETTAETTYTGTANVDICATEVTLETTTEMMHSGTANVDICSTEITQEHTPGTAHTETATLDLAATEVTLEHTSETAHTETTNADASAPEISEKSTLEATSTAMGMEETRTDNAEIKNPEQNEDQEVKDEIREGEDSQVNALSAEPKSEQETASTADDHEKAIEAEETEAHKEPEATELHEETVERSDEAREQLMEQENTESKVQAASTTDQINFQAEENRTVEESANTAVDEPEGGQVVSLPDEEKPQEEQSNQTPSETPGDDAV